MIQSSAASVALIFLRAINRRITAKVIMMAIAILAFTIASPRLFLTAILMIIDDKFMILQIFEFRSRILQMFKFKNKKLKEISKQEFR